MGFCLHSDGTAAGVTLIAVLLVPILYAALGPRRGREQPFSAAGWFSVRMARFSGMLLAEYSIEGLYRYGIPAELGARYAISLLDAEGALLAGSAIRTPPAAGIEISPPSCRKFDSTVPAPRLTSRPRIESPT